LKANNNASAKTIVQALQVSAARSGHNLTITWPNTPPNGVLEYATSLRAPVTWTPVTPPGAFPTGNGALPSPTTNGTRFFRVHAP